MAITSIQANGTGTFSVTGGANVTYSSIGIGKLANLSAPLSAPEWLEIQSTLANDIGKESSYLVKLSNFVAPPVGSPYGSPDPRLQVHMVIKGDTSVFTDVQIIDLSKRLAHLIITPNFLMEVLRGNR